MLPPALRRYRHRLIAAFLWTVGGSFAATIAFSDIGWRTPLRQLIVGTLVNCLFSACCVFLCAFGLPWLIPRIRERLAFPLYWTVIFIALMIFGTVGSLTATALAVAVRLVPASGFMQVWYPSALKVSVYFTLIFGLGAAALAEARGRLATTTVALRTKERDEAEARRLAAEAQLASLESRVDPHFLFNTLNSIAALVRENPAAAERVIEQLAALMRSSLDRRAVLVTVEDELALVRSYLEIERVRFGERLRFSIAAAAGAERALVPRLSLQTLVENCVKYAVSPSREGATISVGASTRDGTLCVVVQDNGAGFDPSYLPEGHGLHLLRSRLAMTFGDRATLSIESRPGETSVQLALPVQFVAAAPVTPTASDVDKTSDSRTRCL
jgi:sensor histidine kinase YesM